MDSFLQEEDSKEKEGIKEDLDAEADKSVNTADKDQ